MLYLSSDVVWNSPVLDIAYSGEIIRTLFEDKKNGNAVAGQEIPLFPQAVDGGFYSLPSYLDRYQTAGIKWTSHVRPSEGGKALGSYTKPVIILNDYKDGRPIALIDGLEISAIRTGSVSFNYLTRYQRDGRCGEKNRILCCGAGHQAKWQIIAALKAIPHLEKLSVWSRDADHAEACLEKVRDILDHIDGHAALAEKVVIVKHFEDAIPTADLVIGATSAKEPYLTKEHLKDASYLHIGMNDVEGDAIRTYDKIYCDDFEAGTKKSAQSLFVLYRKDPSIASRVTLIENAPEHIEEKRVMFDSFGLSIFDVALGCEVLRYAKEKDLGEKIDLYPPQ